MNLTEEDWDRMHRVNAKGVFFCLQRAAQEMIPRREGRIINIASIAGRGFPGTSNAAYAASKGAVISLTKTAAQQLARHNLNVNAICPGVTMTEMVTRLVTQRAEKEGISVDEAKAAAVKPIPLRRANDPRGHRGDGGLPRLARRPQHHRAVLQRGRRPRHELSRPPGPPRRTEGDASGGPFSTDGPSRIDVPCATAGWLAAMYAQTGEACGALPGARASRLAVGRRPTMVCAGKMPAIPGGMSGTSICH